MRVRARTPAVINHVKTVALASLRRIVGFRYQGRMYGRREVVERAARRRQRYVAQRGGGGGVTRNGWLR